MSETPRRPHPGDDGQSDLLSGDRPPKDSAVFNALGMLDELNSTIGLLRVAARGRAADAAGANSVATAALDTDLRAVQLTLGRIMAVVAGMDTAGTDDAKAGSHAAPGGFGPDLSWVEEREQTLRAVTTIGTEFYVPGDGTEASARADYARAKCRTAERAVLGFIHTHVGASANPALTSAARYLNRLSDFLFVAARHLDE